MKPAGILLLALLTLSGCGTDPNLPTLVPVKGTVTLDGKPLGAAVVRFVPDGPTPGTGATGRTNPDGTYTLEARHGKGAPAGEYKIFISKLIRPDGSDFPADSPVGPIESNARELLSPKYSDMQQLTLKATVPPGGATLDYPLVSKPR